MATMRSYRIEQPGSPDDLKLIELPIPEAGPGQVRIRVAYCSLNPLDTVIRAGKAPWMGAPWPFTPGVEHSGVVDAIGPGVDFEWMGRAVISRQGHGGNADYSLAEVSRVVPIGDGMDLVTGAVYRSCSHTAWRVLHEAARTRPGQHILVHSAAGPVGIMLTQFAVQAGLKVIGLVGGPGKQAYAAPFGAHHLVDTRAQPDWAPAVREIVGAAGVHLAVDGIGGADSAKNLEVIAPGGEVIFIGSTSGTPASPIPPGLLIIRHAAARGFHLDIAEKIGARAEDVDGPIRAGLKSGTLKSPVSSINPFDSVPDLHRRFENREIQGRAVIEVGGSAVEAMRK